MNRIIAIFIFLISYFVTFSQTPAHDPHWQLKWQDNFDFLDLNKWNIADNKIPVPDTKEPQLYLENQIWTSNGNLVIEVNNIPADCPDPAPLNNWVCAPCEAGKTYNYRSGCIQTKRPNFNTRYGYIEARIKLPFRRVNNKSWGFWPAFWTIGADPGANSNAAEIDIFEMFSGQHDTPNTLMTCIHRCYPTSTPPCDDRDKAVSHYPSNFNYTDWHTYAIEWNKDRLIWYVDGKAIRTFSNHSIIGPVMIIVNLAIQEENKYYPPTSPTFKEYMHVDYVKVYSLKCDKNTVINEISNFNTYNYAVKKSISLSGATVIPSGSNISLRAADFIELKPGFEVQTGRELYLDVTPCENITTAAPNPGLPNVPAQ